MRISIFLLSFLLLFQSLISSAKTCRRAPIKIAVLDTGFGFRGLGWGAKLCSEGHKDFSIDKIYSNFYDTKVPVPSDIHGHGTNVVGIIEEYLRKNNINYCIVVIKYYSLAQDNIQNLKAEVKSFQYAADLKVDFINYSGGGPVPDREERAQVKRFLDNGGTLIAAAGNEHANLDRPNNEYYPALYDDRIIVVGNLDKDGVRSRSSNYGSAVNRWEVGENVTGYGITMTGTSQATAVATGKIVSSGGNKCDIGF